MSPDQDNIPDDGPSQETPFLVGNWQVQPSRNLLSWAEGDVQVTHKSMEILCLLADAGGEVLSRQYLMQKVWAGTVVNEESLTRVISDLRRALGDDRSQPRYIETIPKRGYRLLAEVVWNSPPSQSEDPSVESSQEIPQEQGATPQAREKSPRRWLPVAIAAGVVVALIAGMRWVFPPTVDELPPAVQVLEVVPLTSDPGQDAHPAFSTDGTRLAFSRRPSDQERYHVYVKQPGQAREIKLTEGPTDDIYPAWSPDGSMVALFALVETGGISA